MENNLTGTTRQKVDYLIEKNNKLYRELIQSWCPYHLINDFYNDLYLTLIDYPKNKIEKYIKQNAFNYLVVAIIKNNLKSNKSQFKKKYMDNPERQSKLEIKLNGNIKIKLNGNQIENNIEKDVYEEIHQNEDYKSKYNKVVSLLDLEIGKNPKFIICKFVFLKYVELGNMRAVAEKTNIKLSSVHFYIKKAQKVIKSGIKVEETNKNGNKNILI